MCGIPGLVLGTYIHHDLECSFSVFLDLNINWIVVDIVTFEVIESLSHGYPRAFSPSRVTQARDATVPRDRL